MNLHWPGGLNPLDKSRWFCSWRVPGPILTISWLILSFKTPPRPSKTLPRRLQDALKSLQDALKSLIFLSFFLQGFFRFVRFIGHLGPTWPPRRHQNPPRHLQELPRRLQDVLKTLPRRLQEPPRRSEIRDFPWICF